MVLGPWDGTSVIVWKFSVLRLVLLSAHLILTPLQYGWPGRLWWGRGRRLRQNWPFFRPLHSYLLVVGRGYLRPHFWAFLLLFSRLGLVSGATFLIGL